MTVLPWLILAFAFGACIGSFLNVVILRMPQGMSLVHPPSHDPSTGRKLAWWENIPIVSYALILRGKSRSSGQWISPQYLIVELITAVLFVWLVWVYYGSALRGDFSFFGVGMTWPVLLVHLTLISALVAATVIDARLFIIPLPITWLVVLVALVGYPIAAAFDLPPTGFAQQSASGGVVRMYASPWVNNVGLLTFGGAAVGWVFAVVLWIVGLLPQAFDESRLPKPEVADESVSQPQAEPVETAKTQAVTSEHDKAWSATALVSLVLAMISVGLLVITIPLVSSVPVSLGLALGVLMFAWAGLIVCGVMRGRADVQEIEQEITAFDNPRAEVLREALFVAFPIVGALVGYAIAVTNGLIEWPEGEPLVAWVAAGIGSFTAGNTWVVPAWLEVLGGVLAGYIVGGGIVWSIRILATLVFNREAMGLGDVHLMAAVGAVLGGVDVAIAFFIAPFMGLAAVALMFISKVLARGEIRMIPYGPYLAAASIVMMAARIPIGRFLGIF